LESLCFKKAKQSSFARLLNPVLEVPANKLTLHRCYTNHALDQYLENLIELGITKIIRIGGQSKSSTLADHNLQHLKKDDTRTKSEGSQIYQCHKNLDADQENANDILGGLSGLHKSTDWRHLKGHILADYRQIFAQFSDIDQEGFKVAGRHPFDSWRTKGLPGLL
jgi:hypothetical protein